MVVLPVPPFLEDTVMTRPRLGELLRCVSSGLAVWWIAARLGVVRWVRVPLKAREGSV